MIRFFCISSFRPRLAALLKVKRGVYSGVSEEICNAFHNLSIEQIRSNRDMILMSSESITIKMRIPDKKQRLSKSDGYRLIYLVLKHLPVVVLLDVYPKRGPLQQLDISDNETNRLVSEFYKELENNSLLAHDIKNNLAVIPMGE